LISQKKSMSPTGNIGKIRKQKGGSPEKVNRLDFWVAVLAFCRGKSATLGFLPVFPSSGTAALRHLPQGKALRTGNKKPVRYYYPPVIYNYSVNTR